MLSKNKIKFIQSLSRKKIRDQENVFLVEGNKMVLEAISCQLNVKLVAGIVSFLSENDIQTSFATEVITCTEEELRKASLLKNPQQALAVIEKPSEALNFSVLAQEFSLALDFIQDPGNLGTIIRIADWFGIKHIICSPDTVDCYNPKVIQASMGAIFRVKIHYADLKEVIQKAAANDLPVFGTFLKGENIYHTVLPPNGILVMGNEGNGISKEVERLIDHKIHIPSFQTVQTGSESLNVATATAICCSEFKRRIIR